jgi:GPH family glycoside/pentoside/hexuronide:cation symporter
VFGALLPIFYQDYLGLSARWIAIASAIYAIWNALNDPIFGYISDSTRSKRGRRIPYMRYTAPFLAATFILVWLAPQHAGDFTLFMWMLVSMVLYDGCYTMIGLVFGPAAGSKRIRHRAQPPANLILAVRTAGHAAGLHHPGPFPPKGGCSALFLPIADCHGGGRCGWHGVDHCHHFQGKGTP